MPHIPVSLFNTEEDETVSIGTKGRAFARHLLIMETKYTPAARRLSMPLIDHVDHWMLSMRTKLPWDIEVQPLSFRGRIRACTLKLSRYNSGLEWLKESLNEKDAEGFMIHLGYFWHELAANCKHLAFPFLESELYPCPRPLNTWPTG